MKILKFNEMYVKTGKSDSRKKTYYDVVHSDPTSAKSPASNLLLKKQYIDQEMELVKPLEPQTNKPKKAKKKNKYNRIKITINNQKFLQKTIEEKGELRCEYCGKGPLKIYDFTKGEVFNDDDGATSDHKTPISKGGDVWSFDNMAVACRACNHKKGSLDYDSWISYLGK